MKTYYDPRAALLEIHGLPTDLSKLTPEQKKNRIALVVRVSVFDFEFQFQKLSVFQFVCSLQYIEMIGRDSNVMGYEIRGTNKLCVSLDDLESQEDLYPDVVQFEDEYIFITYEQNIKPINHSGNSVHQVCCESKTACVFVYTPDGCICVGHICPGA